MIDIILMVVAAIALVIGSYTDLKTREVPDWINYSIMFMGLGLRLIYTVYTSDYIFFVKGLLGFAVAFVLGMIMYYTGQWGGGDTKMLMGIGALIGLDFEYINSLVIFLVNVLIVGAIYGVTWTLVLAVKKWKHFWKKFKLMVGLKPIRTYRRIVLVIAIFLLIMTFVSKDIFTKIMSLTMLLLFYTTFYLWIIVKVVEEVAMITLVEPEKLTEGDWIVHDIKYKGKVIASPKDLGVTKEQIEKLKKLYKEKKIKKVMIKNGIPFVPSFLIAFILLLWFGNWISLLF